MKNEKNAGGPAAYVMKRKTGIQFLILAVLIGVIAAATVGSAVGLHAAMDRSTQSYVKDVAAQLAADIDGRLKNNSDELELVGDSLIRMQDRGNEAVRDYLQRKSAILDLDFMAVIGMDGTVVSTSEAVENLRELPGIRDSLAGRRGVSFLDGQTIVYSVPLYEGEKVVGALAGSRGKENMQRMIQAESFGGQGLTCIADEGGKVIISPTELEPFLQLDDIFKKESEGETAQKIYQMQENMKIGCDGVFSFVAVDGTQLVLSYNTLKSYGWVLLTLVPADLISYETDKYIMQTFCIVAGTIVLFLFFLLCLLYIQKNNRKQLEKIAFVDAVTGGMSSMAFRFRLMALLENAPPDRYTVVFLNIRNFKLINESFGSRAGDDTLRYCMRVLERNIFQGELAGRGEEDSYYLCLRENKESAVRARLEGITEDINSFNKKREADTAYCLAFRQGAYVVEEPQMDITIIQDRAKTACLWQQDHTLGECVFYDNRFMQSLRQEHELTALFQGALDRGEFLVYLQPKVRLSDGKTAGAEALVRWRNPQRGMIFPSDFIPVFEKNGSICKLDRYIFEKVCELLARRMQEGKAIFPVSVNLSRQHFKDPDFLRQFSEIADKYHIPDGILELELTESIFFDDQGIEFVGKCIRRMHRLGFKCSLDDFGSGYSSLGLLREFDVDTIKLDRRFFLDISQPKAEDVLICLTELGRRLGVQIVAEGIEKQEQIAFLKRVRCDMVQGYFYSRPLPVEEFWEWLEKRQEGEGNQ